MGVSCFDIHDISWYFMIFHDIQSSGLLASHWLVATKRKRFFHRWPGKAMAMDASGLYDLPHHRSLRRLGTCQPRPSRPRKSQRLILGPWVNRGSLLLWWAKWVIRNFKEISLSERIWGSGTLESFRRRTTRVLYSYLLNPEWWIICGHVKPRT